MQQNENDMGKSVLVKTYEGTACKEISAEYNLPDYLPDINRLLKISAEIMDESRYLSGDTLEYDGKIRFTVLYATGDGKLKSASFDSDFTGNTPLAGASGDCDIRFDPAVESVSCRLQNPRKLTAKARVCGVASVYCRHSTVPVVSGRLTVEEEGAIEYRTDILETTGEAFAEELGASVSEDIELDAAMPTMEEVIAVELTPFVTETRVGDGKLTYKGEVMANILYQTKGESPSEEGSVTPSCYVSFLRSIPISGEILSDAFVEGAVPMVSVRMDNTEFRSRENAFGESRTVEVDFDFSVFVHSFFREENEVVTDMYSTDYESAEEREKLSYETVVGGKLFNFSADGNVSRDDKDFDRIVGETATATVTSAEKEGGKLLFTGKADVSVILTNGAGVYQTRSFEVPFRAETDGSRLPDGVRLETAAHVMSHSARMDESNLYADLEIGIPYIVLRKGDIEAVRASTVFKDKPVVRKEGSALTLCYPAAGDSLWDIAKKYRTTVSALTAANPAFSEGASGVMIIPKAERGKASYSKLV